MDISCSQDWNVPREQSLEEALRFVIYVSFCQSFIALFCRCNVVTVHQLHQRNDVRKSEHYMHHSICDLDTGKFSRKARQPRVRDLIAAREVQSGDIRASSSQTRQPCVRDLTAAREVQSDDSTASSN